MPRNVVVAVPADAMGRTIPDSVIHDVVERALGAVPIVARNHIHGAFNTFMQERNYASAIDLAGVVMRWAMENQR